jgi:hypothetical protein
VKLEFYERSEIKFLVEPSREMTYGTELQGTELQIPFSWGITRNGITNSVQQGNYKERNYKFRSAGELQIPFSRGITDSVQQGNYKFRSAGINFSCGALKTE